MQIRDETTIPRQPARYAEPPPWLKDSPVRPAVDAQTSGGGIYLHQSLALDLIGQQHNVVISTGTASGKSLVFQAPTLDHLSSNPQATAIAVYPIKALARDQVIRWQQMAKLAGLNPEAINKIDGDVSDLTERTQLLQRTRIALMTPDVIQQWLMAYSEPMYPKRPDRRDMRRIQDTQYNVRRFISNLAFFILDEAHTYDGALGTHCLYLLHRLQQKRRELLQPFQDLRFIAASATIHNPVEHLERLTGLPFQCIDDRHNGTPKAELTVQHAVGREPRDDGWQDLQDAIRQTLTDQPAASYIAFVDDRQIAERVAAGIEAPHSITEDAIIVESRDAMAYRSGLMRRERIEQALREGQIRGITSTSAMEMGIDIPDLNVGFNLGLHHSIARIKQRAGRVGRTSPGRFVIVAPGHAFQFHQDSLATYWNQPMAPARLYPSNPNIKNTHGRCLAKETDLNGRTREVAQPQDTWPEQLPQTLREIALGDHYAPEFQTGDPAQPHKSDIRDTADPPARILQLLPEGKSDLLTNEMTRREAARDAYPLATYYHAKQTYFIERWRESSQETLITARHAPPRETRPITRTGAVLTLAKPRQSEIGHIEYCSHNQATAWEHIIGCRHRTPGDPEWQETMYASERIPDVVSELHTTATLIIIWQDWFDPPEARRSVARALRAILCSRESIHPSDIRTTHQNITVDRNGRISQVDRAIVVWDKVGGGLGLCKNLADNLTQYAESLLQIAQSSGPRQAKDELLRPHIAARLLEWAQQMGNLHTPDPATPIITEYCGTTFRSKLEARWAAYFDRNSIPWQYEPGNLPGWLPDFRITFQGTDLLAEVKPVSELPLDVARRINDAAAGQPTAILGAGPQHAWICADNAWTPLQLKSATSDG